jgi:flagella basal body P-ring formation protein FlgA
MACIPVRDVTQFAKRSKANPSRIARTHVFAVFGAALRTLLAVLIVALPYSAINTASADVAVFDSSQLTNRTQSIASIRATAEQFVRDSAANLANENAKLFVAAAELDSRLQLETCQGALSAFTLNGAPVAARVTVGVRCDQGANWTVYVPMMVESEIDVLVLRNSMQRDSHVATSDMEVQHRRVPGFGGAYITNVDTLRDQHLKRPIPAGTVLLADMMARDLVVKRGQQVMLVFDSHGIVIQAPGLALADGGTADRIRVQNQTSLKVVEGIIESGNLVRVGM